MKLTQVTLLGRMQLGRDYSPTYLAQYLTSRPQSFETAYVHSPRRVL